MVTHVTDSSPTVAAGNRVHLRIPSSSNEPCLRDIPFELDSRCSVRNGPWFPYSRNNSTSPHIVRPSHSARCCGKTLEQLVRLVATRMQVKEPLLESGW